MRPVKLSADVEERIITAVREGASLKVAAGVAGIDPRSLTRWRARGRDGDVAFGPFCRRLDAAIQESELTLIQIVRKAARRDWKAAAWLLERRFRKRWAKDQPAKAAPTNGLELLTDAELEAVAREVLTERAAERATKDKEPSGETH
jgi:hypothetical protein